MKNLFLAAVLTVSSFAFASKWTIDGAHSEAKFGVKHLTISTVTGKLGAVSGTVEIDDKDINKSKVNVSIDLKGIDTEQTKRDDHLRSPDFFDIAKFPAVTFTSKSFKVEGTKATVTGDLKIKDVTKEVTLVGELTNEVANPFSKAKTRAFSGSTTINRKDFGLTWNMALETGGVLVGEEVKVEVQAEFTKDEAPAAAPAPKK